MRTREKHVLSAESLYANLPSARVLSGVTNANNKTTTKPETLLASSIKYKNNNYYYIPYIAPETTTNTITPRFVVLRLAVYSPMTTPKFYAPPLTWIVFILLFILENSLPSNCT